MRTRPATAATLVTLLTAAAAATPAPAQLRRVSTVGEDAVHYYFQNSPESPDGRRIVYSVLRTAADSTDVYLATRDGGDPRRVASVRGVRHHSGANAIWVDDHRIAYADDSAFRVRIHDLRTGREVVAPGAVSHYSPVRRAIAFDADHGQPLPAGVYALDVDSGRPRLLVPLDSLRRFAPLMKRPFQPERWRLDHVYWSPDGKRINFQVKADSNSNNTGDFAFFADADGSGLQFAGVKPMHIQWWDEGSVYGHDWHRVNDKYLRRYDLQGRMLETVAGHGNHAAVSPDRRWIATESWYNSDPVVLRLYRRGDTTATAVLWEQPARRNGLDFWAKRSHTHPAFSRDGRRVYFNGVGPRDRGSQLYAYDLGALTAARPTPPARRADRPTVDPVRLPSRERWADLPLRPHPRLFLPDARVAELRRQVRSDSVSRAWYAQLKRTADGYLGDGDLPRYQIPDGLRLLATSRRVLERVATLGVVGRIEDDDRYRQRAWQELRAAAAFPDWNPKHFLDVGEMTAALAIGYDWWYHRWTPAQRKVMEDAIVRHGLRPALDAYAGNPVRTNWPAAEHNWNQVTNGGVAIGALAIRDRHPALAAQLLDEALWRIPLAARHFGPDGAWAEGPGYWDYATLYNTLLVDALRTATGGDFGLAAIPGYDQAGWFPLHTTGPTGVPFAFADAGRDEPAAKGAALLWMAHHFREPAFAAHQVRYTPTLDEGRGNPFSLIWYHPAPQLAGDPPTARHFRDAEVVALRTAWSDPAATYVALKGGSNRINHANLDLGTWVMDALGVRWATELGKEDYNLPGYFSYADGERWKYYRMRAEGQNTLVLNPGRHPDQDTVAAAPVVGFRPAPGGGHAVVDLSAAYARDARSARRGIALLDGGRVLVQDEISAAAPLDGWWFMHTEAQVEVDPDGRGALLTREGRRLRARILSPGATRFTVMDARPLPGSPDPGGQDPNTGIRKLAVKLHATTDARLAVLLTPMPGGREPALPAPTLRPLAEW